MHKGASGCLPWLCPKPLLLMMVRPVWCSHHFSNPRPDFHGQGDVRGKSFQIYRGQQPVAEVSQHCSHCPGISPPAVAAVQRT